MRPHFVVTLLILALFQTACNRHNFECEDGVIHITNPSADPDSIVVYSWNEHDEDTLFAGETATYSTGHISYKRGFFGFKTSSSWNTSYFQTSSITYLVDVTSCDMTIDAPAGFIYLRQNCDNGKADYSEGELGVDCGGYCDACPELVPPCTPNSNTIDFDGLIGADAELWSSGYGEGFNDSYLAHFTFDNGFEFDATFYIPKMPRGSRSFIVGQGTQEVSIRYNEGWGYWYANEGQEVFLIQNETGAYRLVFCDLELSKDNFTVTATADLDLIL